MLGIIFAVCISIGLPLLLFLYAIVKKRLIPFLLGILAFLGSQVFIRIPILQYLQDHSTAYSMFSAKQPLLFIILYGLSAGVFEELARFIMMTVLMKQRDWLSGFLFGAGHGGIEAVIFVGISVLPFLLSTPTHSVSIAFLTGGIERFFAMILHIGLSIIILQAVVQKKFYYVLIAIIIHGSIDALIGIFPLFIPADYQLIVIEVLIAVIAIAVFSYSLLIKRREIL